MPRRVAAAVLLHLFLGALTLSAPAQAADAFTLGRDVVFGPTDRQFVVRDFPFRLPANARQGRGAWYLVRLHFRLEIDPRSGPGRIYVVAATNDRACAQLRFTTVRTPQGLRVESSELGLVAGLRSARGSSLVHERRFRNFVQYAGVRGGRNVLTFKVEQYDAARIRSLRVFADSGIERTGSRPAQLVLEPFLERGTIHAGDDFKVRFRLRNSGGTDAVEARVRVLPGAGLTTRGAAVRSAGPVEAGSAREGTFTLVARRPGRHELVLVGESVFGSPLAQLEVRVEPQPTGKGKPVAIAAAAAAVLVAAAVGAWFLRRKRV